MNFGICVSKSSTVCVMSEHPLECFDAVGWTKEKDLA